jgi:dUTPase
MNNKNIHIYVLNNGVKLPQKAFNDDAAYDVVALSEPNVVGVFKKGLWECIDYIEYSTNLFVMPNENDPVKILIYPRSSISKYNLLLCNSVGTVDNSYRGEIKLRFKYISQPKDFVVDRTSCGEKFYTFLDYSKIYNKGDKIGQISGEWVNNIKWEYINDLNETNRGVGGFGHTGR